jgi:hypothetical protein
MKLGLFGLMFVLGCGMALGYCNHDTLSHHADKLTNMVGDTPRKAASKLNEALESSK